MKILVTGSNGQLGSELQVLSKESSDDFIFLDRKSMDLSQSDQISKVLEAEAPDIIINAAAYTAVDAAESDSEIAHMVNVDAVRQIASYAKNKGIFLIHISSDYVYHSITHRPIKENDPTDPQGVYAKTKLLGEQAAVEICAKCVIIRTSWVYSSFGNNFVKTMLRLAVDRDQLSIVEDQVGVPTYAKDIAVSILQIIAFYKEDKCTYGIYNFSNTGTTNWYEFAKKIFELEDIKMTLKAIPSSDYPTPADRPKWSLLNLEKITQEFDISPRSWEAALSECLLLLKES